MSETKIASKAKKPVCKLCGCRVIRSGEFFSYTSTEMSHRGLITEFDYRIAKEAQKRNRWSILGNDFWWFRSAKRFAKEWKCEDRPVRIATFQV